MTDIDNMSNDNNETVYHCTHGYNSHSISGGDKECRMNSVVFVDQIKVYGRRYNCDAQKNVNIQHCITYIVCRSIEYIKDKFNVDKVCLNNGIAKLDDSVSTFIQKKYVNKIVDNMDKVLNIFQLSSTLPGKYNDKYTEEQMRSDLNELKKICKMVEDTRIEYATIIIRKSTLESKVITHKGYGLLNNVRFMFGIKEGHSTEYLGMVYTKEKQQTTNISTSSSLSYIMYYDHRIRCSRVDADLCRDCALYIRYCE